MKGREIAEYDHFWGVVEDNGVKCPHCGHVRHDDLWESFPREGEQYETECGHCERPFTVSFSTSATYRTKRVLRAPRDARTSDGR